MVHGLADAWPWQGVVLAGHLARFFSLLLGAVTVLSAYGIALCLFPGRRAVAVLAASLVAFNPQFLFITSSITNIALVTAACSAGVWLCVRLLDRYARGPHDAGAGRQAAPRGFLAGPTLVELLLLGTLVGVAALAQLSGVALVGLAGLTLLAVAWRQRAPFRNLVLWIVIVGAAAFLVAGWWYVRNLALYGDPLGLQAMFDVLPKRAARPTLGELVARAQGVWRSMWAVFGWFNVIAPEWVYAVYAAVSLVGLAGLLFAWPARRIASARGRRVRVGEAEARFPLQFLLLLVWIGVMLLLVFVWTQMRYPQGRLLFPALAAISVLLAFGITNWFPPRLDRALAVVLPAGLGVLAVVAPLAWIAPAYAAPVLLDAAARVPNPVDVDFGGQLRLAGYEIEPDQVQPGGLLPLTLYWQASAPPAADYSIFVHLVDENGILQAQHDSYPGAGSLPTSEWPQNATIPDRHVVQLPRTAIKSSRLAVLLGAYDYSTGQRLGVEGGDLWQIGEVAVSPKMSVDGIPNPVDINFGNQIAVKGFDFDRPTLRAGETLKLDLWWEALVAAEGRLRGVRGTWCTGPMPCGPASTRCRRGAPRPRRTGSPASAFRTGPS